ncbi:NUDIX hydrolase [Sulfitobacter pseudonitzschiae]|uniref:NUDIX hydrolase n=1 Tax=Pseudosulfitobacter pseudonitzschiae TaxID=1402135 RepID=A0A9Q2NSR1_9RHOB|nr:NUDIX hydrolase [Pseudosulfitobacter pseudonitzschiae]MBM2294531.1 NUDIX hydrolase [Pseudosulfitobacter pseudonitzschiae]MBM2299345.1 NUDIX hydrolase [Pseudosulfitobacter pseudonitzschiae]MBM2304397.1 NUDIX hydrolase [Pseudosulfitobacter pseudonitzschiae]MBM2314143.1 NUDIX hydrolase [Pseudosulfitobacter pseudonitzschiae]MBM2319058.1 NUDIX hydrolase [Pseudosulfitobacter pseudonitzschiae]
MTAEPKIDKTQIRHAATVIVLRDRWTSPRILMGQRGAKAVFMPNKFVFPGGAVDPGDYHVPLAGALPEGCAARISEDSAPDMAHALSVAAIRELFEETGQVLGQPGDWDTAVPEDWTDFAETGHVPHASALQFVFRAITPPGRPRRFDARFFLVDADTLVTDPDDFSAASDELSHLQWVGLDDVRSFDMPFITEVVLSEVQKRAQSVEPPESVPFFKNNEEENLFLRLRGHLPTD